MTQYVGCEHARDLLDGLLDGELSMADQLSVESHLRWCRTCTLRVQDMRLIGNSLRLGAAESVAAGHGEAAVAAISDAVLMRVRAEREQSFGVRLREMFADMRLLWPALGATAAVAICLGVAASVLQASTTQKPESLAALIATLAHPGSERNPLRPANNGITIPRLLEDDAKRAGGTLEYVPEEDVIYTIRTVVSRDGRTSNIEVLLADGQPLRKRTDADAGRDRAVLDAVQQSRFSPAYTPLGRAVAVDMVWVIAKTTAVAVAGPEFPRPAVQPRQPKAAVTPVVVEPEDVDPADLRSARQELLPTA